jgi:hypothetical protein
MMEFVDQQVPKEIGEMLDHKVLVAQQVQQDRLVQFPVQAVQAALVAQAYRVILDQAVLWGQVDQLDLADLTELLVQMD